MSAIVLGILGAIVGAAVAEGAGFLFGAALGALIGSVLQLRKHVEQLAQEQRALSMQLANVSFEASRRREPVASTPIVSAPVLSPPIAPAPFESAPFESAPFESAPFESAPFESAPFEHAPVQVPLEQPAPIEIKAPTRPAYEAPTPAYARSSAGDEGWTPTPFDRAIEAGRAWLLGGNTVVRVGVLVLLVGVALLVRFAAEHVEFPIELRMTSAAAIGLALVFVGYRQRTARPGFGRTLQGGGIAAMYLVVFFAYRSYELLPPGLAFALLVGIAVSSGALAVAQDAVALIVIGQIGGFMAPVLASSGSGNHVALFSYYLLLNLLTLAIAWVKPWRALNLIGFIFTFGVGSTWGALKYRPDQFASTEPFLIAFFLLYTAIPVLYALKRPVAVARPETDSEESTSETPAVQRGWVDASLVFGTPLATLLLQYAMVKDVPFGMAYSTLALAAVYVGLSRVLHRRAPEALRSMIEAFLAIGIGFATLAVPYGFDNHNLTGATWGLEGAGLYWLGVRQQRWLSRLAGALLPLMGVVAFLYDLDDWSVHASVDRWPLANTVFLAGVLLGFGCLFIARHAHAHRDALPRTEHTALQGLIAIGLCVIFAVGVREIEAHVDEAWRPGISLAWFALIALGLELAGRALRWLPGRLPGVLVFASTGIALMTWALDFEEHPLSRAGWIGFALSFAAVFSITRRLPSELPSARYLHVPMLWLVAFGFALEAGFLVADFAHLREEWSVAAGTLVLASVVLLTVKRSRSERYPFDLYRALYLGPASGTLAGVLLLQVMLMTFTLSGDATPLPYFPLLNPVDVALLACLLAFGVWARELRLRDELELLDPGLLRALPAVLAAFAFLAWNGLLARSVHHYAHIRFDGDALWRSTPLQVAFSISWSLLGLLATGLASKRGLRVIWIAGAALLAVVVLKLFTVDLTRLSTIAKIATFLVVGLLLVLVGFFAPVPPINQPTPEPKST